jgi:trk system potassium uptake protein TrkH
MRKFNIKIILQLMGVLLLFNGGFMLISGLVSWYFNDGAIKGILMAAGITLGSGLLLRFVTKGFIKQIKKREG